MKLRKRLAVLMTLGLLIGNPSFNVLAEVNPPEETPVETEDTEGNITSLNEEFADEEVPDEDESESDVEEVSAEEDEVEEEVPSEIPAESDTEPDEEETVPEDYVSEEIEEQSDELLEGTKEPDEVITVTAEGETVSADTSAFPDNDQMLEAYFDLLTGMKSSEEAENYDLLQSTSVGSDLLIDNDATAYGMISDYVDEVVAGERTSTSFTIPVSTFLGNKFSYTAQELRVNSIISNNNISAEAKQALLSKFEIDIQSVLDALRLDNPYKFYWMYRGAYSNALSYPGISAEYSTSLNEFVLYVDSDAVITINLWIDETYRADISNQLVINSARVTAAQTAAANAQSIVNDAASKSDYEKLLYYNDWICNNVAYNHTAASQGPSQAGIDPWEVINVFDDNPDTNVVCEGYSKAFKYLADLSDFESDSVEVYTVTGTMYGQDSTGAGAHMWNVVKMDDGKTYMVDVTNNDIDEDTVHIITHQLFLSGYDALLDGKTSAEAGYTVNWGSVPVESGTVSKDPLTYEYDDETIGFYPGAVLAIEGSDYTGSDDSSDFEYSVDPDKGEVTITKYIGSSENVRIPSEIGGYPVTCIGDGAFRECGDIISVTIPDSVFSIGVAAFRSCAKLTSVTIPANVSSIGTFAFGYCRNLSNVRIPDSVTNIEDYTFYDCGKLNNIIIPDGILSIGQSAFGGCSSLTSITIPESVTTIKTNPFAGCVGLEQIIVDENNRAFDSRNNCNAIIKKSNNELVVGCKSTLIPEDVTSIGNSAFSGCQRLTAITIPDSVTSIKASAFHYCSRLSYIIIPDQVTYIGSAAFELCEGISEITIPNRVTTIGEGAFRDCKNLISIILPDNLTQIDSRVFVGCTSLKSVAIPDSVTRIGYASFYGCYGLTDITIPNSVTMIDYSAFENCIKLENVTYIGNSAEWESLKNTGIKSGNTSLTNLTPVFINPFWTITFDNNGGSGSMEPQRIDKGNTATLSKNTFSKTHSETICVSFNVNYVGGANPVDIETTKNTAYVFDGWAESQDGEKKYNDRARITPNSNLTLYAIWMVQTPVVGSVTLPSVTRTGYTFEGWYQNEACTGDSVGSAEDPYIPDQTETLYAKWSKNSYTITWLNDDDTLIDTTTVEYGDVPTHADPVKAATAEFTYTFVGWTPEVTAVTGTATYKASFTAATRSYTIKWLNDDGSVIDTTSVQYGTVPTHADAIKPSTAQYSYTFERWDPAVTSVTGEAIYTAKYIENLRTYIVTWKNYDGSVLETDESVSYGATPYYNSDIPSRPATAQYSYSFAGWNPSINASTTITEDTIYKAKFTSELNKYLITWKNWDGTVLKTESVEYGKTPAYNGTTPVKASDTTYTYSFTGWSPAIGAVTGEKTYTAAFSANKKTIAVSGVSLNKTSLSLEKGNSTALTATVSPSNATNITVIWSSNNTKVATVNAKGNVTATGAGTATITVKTADGGKTASCTVTVKDPVISVSGVKLSQGSLSLETGKSAKLSVTINPSNATNKSVIWSSSNAKVATVDANGNVKAARAGTATITVKTADGGKTASCTVTVKQAKDPTACKADGFCSINGKDYWYEQWIRQGVYGDTKNVRDKEHNIERGREVCDMSPATKGWYWLDAVYDGAKAVNKEVYMPYIFQDEKTMSATKLEEWRQFANTYTENPNGETAIMGDQLVAAVHAGTGKWVRYDGEGKMYKGWLTISDGLELIYPNQAGNTYYYDYATGLMAKGWTTIGGRNYHFDEITGVLLK